MGKSAIVSGAGVDVRGIGGREVREGRGMPTPGIGDGGVESAGEG
jgi:hypothetical protein